MRILFPLALVMLAAACGTTPGRSPVSTPAPGASVRSGTLVGLGASELAARLGQPVLRIAEGPGVKLQYRGAACILDAYLYPPASGSGQPRVTHVDARNREGAAVAPSACLAALQMR